MNSLDHKLMILQKMIQLKNQLMIIYFILKFKIL